MKIEKIIPIIAMLLIVIMGGCTKNSTTPAVNPTVTSTDPANSATNIGVNSKINVNFSVAMDPATITTATFTVKQGATAVAGAVTYTGTEATFTPTNKLGSNMVYTVTITTGAKNTTGTSMLSNYTSTFTTATVVSPGISSTDPASNATNVSVNKSVVFTFSKAMNPASITGSTFTVKKAGVIVPGTVTYSADAATFTPTNGLDAGATYTASMNSTVMDVAGNELGTNNDFSFTTSNTAASTTVQDVNLGESGNYAILAKTSINNASASVVTGNMGLGAAESNATGFSLSNSTESESASSAEVTGKIYATDMGTTASADLGKALDNMVAAYANIAGRTNPNFTEMGAGNIGGMTLAPGLYKWTTGVTIPSNVTISGSANDIWIFQIAGNLDLSNAMKTTLIGGALASNIYWQVAGQATLGTTSHLDGILMALTGITLKTGATLTGRAMSQTTVTMDGNTVTSKDSNTGTGN